MTESPQIRIAASALAHMLGFNLAVMALFAAMFLMAGIALAVYLLSDSFESTLPVLLGPPALIFFRVMRDVLRIRRVLQEVKDGTPVVARVTGLAMAVSEPGRETGVSRTYFLLGVEWKAGDVTCEGSWSADFEQDVNVGDRVDVFVRRDDPTQLIKVPGIGAGLSWSPTLGLHARNTQALGLLFSGYFFAVVCWTAVLILSLTI